MTAAGHEIPWHALTAREAMAQLGSAQEGLTSASAASRLVAHGANRLEVEAPISPAAILLAQVRSLVVALLAAAASVSLLLGDMLEAAAIASVLLLNTGIGFWTEWRARKAMAALRGLQVQEAVVRRDGEPRTIDAVDLVPGDVLILEAGSAIAADARLLEVNELATIEAPLTGESLPTEKRVEAVDDVGPVAVADRLSMVYKGTLVAAGGGEAVVVGTGAETEIGRISDLLSGAEERSPLERRLDRLGRRLVGFVLGLAALVVAVGVWRGAALWQMVEMGIALAIAAVPEGLPVVATMALAVGMRRMAARHALIRHLPSVETLGSTTVICTDKTGTLTAGEMTVTALLVAGTSIDVTGSGYGEPGELRVDGARVTVDEVPGLGRALDVAVLANNARLTGEGSETRVEGDPSETALLVLGRKAGRDRRDAELDYPRVGEVPFSSERMLMATFHQPPGGGRIVLLKGAPGKVLGLAATVLEGEGEVALDGRRRDALLAANRRLASRGLRVMALASRELAAEEHREQGMRGEPYDEADGEQALHDLTFVGFVGLSDPPARGVRETVARLSGAGIRTVMVTGDQVVTAEAVARQLGVLRPGEVVLDGRDMLALEDEALAGRVGDVATFARISPRDKLRIVRAFQEQGEIVGMLGDGVNDAPALKQADIGVAMGGRGTDVAKETADMVLSDDSFETVGAAVEEGRVVFDNIRKFVFYLFSCNLSEALVVVASALAGLPFPLLPLQILWLNLITDVFPALALAVEPAEPGLMRRPPRDPREAILSPGLIKQVLGFGGLITIATLGAFVWALGRGDSDPRHATTVAFMTLALAQLLHVFNARSPNVAVLVGRFGRNSWIWAAFLLTVGLQLAALYVDPLPRILHTTPLSSVDWAVVVGASSVALIAGQGQRLLRRRERP